MMPVAGRSLPLWALLSALVPLASCRGGRAAEHDTVSLDPAATWTEQTVFGVADAAFSLLLDDSEIGIRSARRAPVKQLATRMHRDYRGLAERLHSLMEQRRIAPRLPPSVDFTVQHQADAADLRNESRRSFDERYLDHVVTGHQRVMDRMYEAMSAAQDTSVRRLLEDAQRHLETNLSDASRLKAQGTRTPRRRS